MQLRSCLVLLKPVHDGVTAGENQRGLVCHGLHMLETCRDALIRGTFGLDVHVGEVGDAEGAGLARGLLILNLPRLLCFRMPTHEQSTNRCRE